MYPAPCATISAAHAQHQSPRADSNIEAKLDSLTSSIHAVNQRLADMESHHHPHGPRSVLPHSSPQQRESIIQRHLREADLTDEHGSTARAEVPTVTSTSGNSTSPPCATILTAHAQHHAPPRGSILAVNQRLADRESHHHPTARGRPYRTRRRCKEMSSSSATCEKLISRITRLYFSPEVPNVTSTSVKGNPSSIYSK